MTKDTYTTFAERYDWMKEENPAWKKFFQELFAEHGVSTVLDCACGTARDLITLRTMGFQVFGSDISEPMLAQARKNVSEAKLDIPLQKGDYRELPELCDTQFDAVVCLANSINAPLEDEETLKALRSMRAVLRDGGILVFSQGQSDASMRNPPRFVPVVNNRDVTRFFDIEYSEHVETVHIFDFIHTEDVTDYKHECARFRIRLQDSWIQMLKESGFAQMEFFGDWDASPYNKESSRRLIGVATK